MGKAKKTKQNDSYGEKRTTFNEISYVRENPKWTFSKSDNEIWSIREALDDKILDKLIAFERMTWGQIIQVKRNGKHSHNTAHHFIETGNIIKQAQDRLNELQIYEDELFSLSLSNKESLWGILDSGTFRIVWYDKKHEVYPTVKKYT